MRNIILVLSGKGGVGKSTISTELALALRHQGKKVRLPPGSAPAALTLSSSQQAWKASFHPSASAFFQVGILDVDLCGPSIPRMLRAQGKAVHQCDQGWVPVFVDQEKTISLMSVGFLLENPDEAVVWRGPKKHGKNSVRRSSQLTLQYLFIVATFLSFVAASFG